MQETKRKYESPRQVARQRNILRCAREMLSEEGYAGMTMRTLAERAQVAPATLYNLYSSKDELILAAVQDLLDDLGERAAAIPATTSIGGILNINRVIAQQIQSAPQFADALARAVMNGKPGDPIVDLLYARAYPAILAALQQTAAQGDMLPGVDVDRVARHLTAQAWGVTLLWMMGMIPLEDFLKERLRSDLMTLASVTRGPIHERLEALLRTVDAGTLPDSFDLVQEAPDRE